MSTNMTGFGWFSKNLCVLVLWTKIAPALEGLRFYPGSPIAHLRSYLELLGSLQKFEGAAGEFKGAPGTLAPCRNLRELQENSRELPAPSNFEPC